MSVLQDHPRLLEIAFAATHRMLRPFRQWMTAGGAVERAFVVGEQASKGPVFDCRMCGQCVLHYTGMTCPMTCPKNMRNGPCGGVRLDGGCEVLSDRPCIWVQAWQRATRMPVYGGEIRRLLPPLNHQLQGTSAWINDVTGRTTQAPPGWDE
jgi:hypothetical protein